MNKKNIFVAASIMALGLFLFSSSQTPEQHNSSIQTFKMSQPKTKLAKIGSKPNSATRDPASTKRVPSGINERKFKKTRPEVTKYESIKVKGLPTGMSLARNIYALPENEFSGSTDVVVLEKMGMIFFKSQVKPINSTLVAVEDKSGKLYAVSSVIKLENIGPDKRRQLISQGLDEHYYHSATKVLFVQSNPEELLRLNEELLNQNLQPELEVMKGFHQVR